MAGKKGMKILKNNEDNPKFAEYYKKQYPNLTFDQCEEKAKLFKRSCNYQCIEYYERNYPNLSHEEHLKLKQQLQLQRKSNKDTNIEYWKKRYPEKTIEELEELRSNAAKEKNKCNIEYWIKRNPDKSLEEIKILYNNFYQKWLSHQEGWGKGEKNPNHRNNSTEYERKIKSPKCIEFYEHKYSELSHKEHLQLLNKHIEKIKNKVKNNCGYNTTIEYYLNKGMTLEDAELALKERQTTFSLEKCINKYGPEKGLELFKERQQKWLKKLYKNFENNGDGRSLQSKFARIIISQLCKQLNIDYPKKEKYIYDIENKKSYAYDFYYNNKIIEFNGDYWHCNPIIYNKDFWNQSKQKFAKEIWEYDNQKIKCAEKYNYKVLTIWEYDYQNNPIDILNKCYEFLTS